MKKMNSQYNRLNALMENIKDIISDLDGKRYDMGHKAWSEDRCMTDREEKIYNEIVKQIINLDHCVEYIQFAMSRLEEYTD